MLAGKLHNTSQKTFICLKASKSLTLMMSLLLTLNKHILADLWIIPRKASKARKVLRSNTRKYRAEKFHMMLLLRSILTCLPGCFQQRLILQVYQQHYQMINHDCHPCLLSNIGLHSQNFPFF